MATALYEFMPYGAPELIDTAKRRLFQSTATAAAAWVLVFVAVLVLVFVHPRATEPERTVVVPYRELAAPPPLTNAAPPPEIVIAQQIAKPTAGVPVPVPDAQAPLDQTIATQQEIATSTASVGADAGNGSIVVTQAPTAEELPKLNDYVYADELPVLVTDVAPVYPEIAKEAGTEGDVLLRVLIGKDGRVLDVHVDQSNPMLDQAAVDAARKWVFKPALSGNHPVAVWISRRVGFRLTSAR